MTFILKPVSLISYSLVTKICILTLLGFLDNVVISAKNNDNYNYFFLFQYLYLVGFFWRGEELLHWPEFIEKCEITVDI